MQARFGPFSFDLCTLDLRKHGIPLHLEEKPARLLACLIERKGKIVAREELRKRMWPEGVNLDFDHGLNKAVNKLRAVLGDQASTPNYLETLSKRGYRFIHEAEIILEDAEPGSGFASGEPSYSVADGWEGTTEQPKAVSILLENPVSEPAKHRASLQAVLLLLAAVAVIVLLVPAAGRLGHLTHLPNSAVRVMLPFDVNALMAGDNAGLALSPDGKQVVFSSAGPYGQNSLWIRDLGSREARELPGTSESAYPFWSPDGKMIGFFGPYAVNRINLRDSTVVKICDSGGGRGGTWAKDGTILFGTIFGPIYRVNQNGGKPIPVTKLESTYSTHRWPEFMPDGKHFIYLAADHSNSSEPAAIYFGSLDSSQPRFLTNTGSAAKAIEGNLLYVSAGKLTAQPFNPATGLLESNASVLAQDVQFDTKTWFASFTATKETLIYWSSRQPLPRQVISWFDEHGTRLANAGSPGTYGGVRLSPDGKSIATSCGDPDANICIIHQDGSLTRLTNQPLNGNPAWSPDSSSLAYLASRDHSTNSVMVKRLSTDAQERDVAHGGSGFRNGSWSPDGTSLLVWQSEQEVSTLHVKSDILTPYLTNIKGGGAGEFSPDGKWVAYVSSASGRTEVYVSSYPNPVHKFQVSTIGGKNPRWRRDGKVIFFEGPQKTIYSVLVEERGEQLDLHIPRRLFSVPAISTQQAGTSFDVDAAGKRFLIDIDLPGRTPDLVLVTNWRAPDAGRQTSRSLNFVASF